MHYSLSRIGITRILSAPAPQNNPRESLLTGYNQLKDNLSHAHKLPSIHSFCISAAAPPFEIKMSSKNNCSATLQTKKKYAGWFYQDDHHFEFE